MLPTTCSRLLEGLRAETDESLWSEFDARYRPVLVAFARRAALSEPDAHEVAQDTLSTFLVEHRAGRFDRARGRLRSWLFAIARGRVQRLQRERARARERRGESALVEIADEESLSRCWEEEWRSSVLREGRRRLREDTRLDARTLRAFEMLTLEGRSGEEVARELGTTTNVVYVARFRALERLRRILAHLEEEW